MSADALAALLHECPNLYEVGEETVPAACEGDYRLSAAWLRARGVVVLPPDHGPKWDTFVDALGNALVDTDDAWAEVRGVTRELVESAARAVLAVLRKDVA